MLRANVVDRRITRQIPFRLPQGTVGEPIALNMDADWAELDRIMMVWSNTGTGTSVEVELTGTKSTVPSEMTAQPGNLYLSLVGYVLGDDGGLVRRITTSRMVSPWTVDPCGELEGIEVAETGQDLVSSLLAAADAADAAVKSLLAQAEAGAFDGAPGSPVKAGEGFFTALQTAGYQGTREECLAALLALLEPPAAPSEPVAEGGNAEQPAQGDDAGGTEPES